MKKLLTLAAVAAVVGLGATAAQARGDVYWSIGIQAPVYPGTVGVNVGNAPRWHAPVYAPAPIYVTPAPVYGPPPHLVYGPPPVWGHPVPAPRDWRDRDRDGVPNWRDRHDDRHHREPYYRDHRDHRDHREWRDRDRDGRPDWRDGYDNRDWRDRDRDGVPNWRDRRDNRY